MPDSEATVYVSGINAVLQVAERFGVRREELSGFEGGQRRDHRVPVAQLLDVYRQAAARTANPDIALYVGRVAHFAGLHLLRYMSPLCQTFRDYLNLVPSILKLRGDIGEVAVVRAGDLIGLQWRPLDTATRTERFLSDEVLATSVAIVNTLCIDPIPVRLAHFTYAQPGDLNGLQHTFGTALHFNQPVSCLFFDRAALNFPVIKLDDDLPQDLTSGLRDLFVGVRSGVRSGERGADPFLRSVRQALMRGLPSGAASVDLLATELGVSRRTLQRRLALLDTHFQQVLQELRSELAVRYLADNRLGITEIAFLLGYSDQASFSTAFKTWHGKSPSEYRVSN